MKDRQGIVNLRPTVSPRVMVGEHRGWRLYVQDAADGKWDHTGPVFPTRAEAYANVSAVESYAY